MKIIKFKKSKILDEKATCFLKSEIDFNIETKEVINFCLILLFQKEEKIYEIIKYDGSHGFCHTHKYYEKLNAFGKKCYPSQINPKSILIHKKDITQNWKEYLKKYKKKWNI